MKLFVDVSTKGDCMNGKKLITGVVAGVIAFAWGMASWMVLPIHEPTLSKLKGEPVAVQAIKMAAPSSGMYAYPGMDAPKEEMMKAPHILVAINYAEKKMPICMSIGLLIQILGGLALTCMVQNANIDTFGGRMKMICKAVFFTGMVAVVPNWLWWGFTPAYTALAFADLLIARYEKLLRRSTHIFVDRAGFALRKAHEKNRARRHGKSNREVV